MQFTTVRSKEKDLLHLFEVRKTGSQQLGARKKCLPAIGSGKNWFLAISSLTNTVAAIWRERKVDPCYLETKKCSSQLLGARKKIKTSIYSQKNWFKAIRSTEKMLASYLEVEKVFLAISSLTNTVAAIWRERKVELCYLETKNVVHNCQEQGKRL